jgi:hypothetical protein
VVLVDDPVLARLQVDHVALFEVDDLVGHAGQRHRVAREEVLAAVLARAEDQRRAGARADHALRLVAADHGDGVGAVQLQHRGLHGLEQVAVVEAVDQVGDDLGVGLALEHVALGFERGAQRLVVFDDAVVHQRDAAGARALRIGAGAVAEMRVGVVHRRRAVRGPARVGDAGQAFDLSSRTCVTSRPRAKWCAPA